MKTIDYDLTIFGWCLGIATLAAIHSEWSLMAAGLIASVTALGAWRWEGRGAKPSRTRAGRWMW